MNINRVNGRIDINHGIDSGEIIIDEEEQRGTRPNKFWFNNYEFMYKDVYQKTFEDFGEVIAYKLAEKLNIECAPYDFAIYNENFGVITKNIIKDNDNEELISGTEIITRVYAEYIVPLLRCKDKFNDIKNKYNIKEYSELSELSSLEKLELKKQFITVLSTLNIPNIKKAINKYENENIEEMSSIYQLLEELTDLYNEDFIEMKNGIIKSNNLYDIWSVVEIYSRICDLDCDLEKFMDDLIKMFIFDIITSQGDRHADNWSIIVNDEKKTMRLAPLYDNSGICCLNREKAIKNIVDYVDAIKNPTMHIKKKEKISSLIFSTINHNNSGLKVDYDDVVQKNKNEIMINKFFYHSSEEFNKKIIDIVRNIDEELLLEIFKDIEENSHITIDENVKTVVKTVINTNIEMIKDIYDQKDVKEYV